MTKSYLRLNGRIGTRKIEKKEKCLRVSLVLREILCGEDYSNKGWVYGYSIVFYVQPLKDSPVVPLNASSDTANVDGKGFASDAFDSLPLLTKYVGV